MHYSPLKQINNGSFPVLVCLQDVLSIQRVLLSLYSAFPMNAADFYVDVMSSVAIMIMII